MHKDNILEVKHLHKRFFSKGITVKAVTDVSFDVKPGETIGIVGESGCGKTTLGRCIVRAYEVSEGEVLYRTRAGEEVDFLKVDKRKRKEIRKEIQMIFQDPHSSLDPRMTVLDIIKEPLKANYPKMPKAEMDQMAKEMAEKVGLNPTYLMRYPHAFSGGQRQRIGIARALVVKPQIIVCDEAVSALDVSIQAQVINLLNDLRESLGLTIMFIAHDLSVVKYFSDRIGVMYFGKMVELADSDELFNNPLHPYTKSLLSAIPLPDPIYEKQRTRITYNPLAEHDYSVDQPSFREITTGHFVYCNDAEEKKYKEAVK